MEHKQNRQVGFIRVTLLRFESSSRTGPRPIPSESFVSVKIKDAESTGTGVGLSLVQHRRTATHQWNSFFDSHLYNGRVVQMIVKRNPNQEIADTTIGINILRRKCLPATEAGAACDVSPEVPLQLNPGGTLYVKVRYFPGNSSTSSSTSSVSEEALPKFKPAPGAEIFDRRSALPDPIEPESSESDDEIYGVAMRRYAIRHQKVVDVKGHKLIETYFKLPTVCSFCSEFLWGLSKPGLKCQECSCALHKKCHDKILTVCPGSARNSVETQMMTERFHINVPHRFEEHNFLKPTFCEQCGSMLYGLFRQGLKCTECGVNCHKKCEHHMANLCGVNKKILVELQETLQSAGGMDTTKHLPKLITSSPTNGGHVVEDDDDSEDEDEYSDVYEALADNARRICISPSETPTPTSNKKINFDDSESAPPVPSREGRRLPARAGIISIYSTSDSEENYENIAAIKLPVKPLRRVYTLDDFKLHKVLGRGAFGKVILAENPSSNEFYAVKALKKDVVLEFNDVECTLLERRILELGRQNPYITKLFCTFQTPSHLFIVMEYLTGGDLMYHIQHDKKFTNERVQFYSAEIICGLQFLHSNGIIYRDLKPENMLLDREGHVKIADFGMCKDKIFGDVKTSTFCGTPHYIAPEIISGSEYNCSVDWFALGVVMFEMLVGKLPFDGEEEEDVFLSIRTMTPRFPRFLKSDASNCIQLLLEKRPHARLGMITCSAGPIRDHAFFKNINWKDIEQRRVEPSFKPKIKSAGDVRYFEAEFTREPAKLTVTSKHLLSTIDQSLFADFDFTSPESNSNDNEARPKTNINNTAKSNKLGMPPARPSKNKYM